MAKWRAIHGDISTSRQVNELGEFEQLLFTWMIAHADDWGIMTADPFEVKARVIPGSSRTIDEVESALDAIEAVGLIERYQPDGSVPLLHIPEWDKHQPRSLVGKRTASEYPLPDGDNRLSITEADIEGIIVHDLESEKLSICEEPLIHIDRQSRVGNCYIDIVCHAESGRLYLIEVKRHRLTKAAYKQVIRYAQMLKEVRGAEQVAPILVGYGIAQNMDLRQAARDGIDIICFDSELAWQQLVSCHVNWRYLTAPDVKLCQGEDKSRVDKSRVDKNRQDKISSTKSRERDHRLDHLAIKGYKEIARLHIPIPLRDDWIKCADEVGTDYLLESVKLWIGNGWNKQNVNGIMDWSREGRPGRAKDKRANGTSGISDEEWKKYAD